MVKLMMKRKDNKKAGRRKEPGCRNSLPREETSLSFPAAVEAYPLTLPEPRARRLILAALRVWELKNGIHR